MEINWPSFPEISERFDALYQYLNRLYGLDEVSVTVGGETFTIFKVANIDQLLDDAAAQLVPSPDDIPYWSELWPSAIALAQYILREMQMRDVPVLELGCGLGLAGIAAGKQGGEVVFSDLKEDALRLAELNWMVNFHTPVATRVLDWRTPQEDVQFPLMIAADVAYEERLFAPLIRTFQTLLAPGGEILLSEPNRTVARAFFDMLQNEGFVYHYTTETVPLSHGKVDIGVYRIRRRSG